MEGVKHSQLSASSMAIIHMDNWCSLFTAVGVRACEVNGYVTDKPSQSCSSCSSSIKPHTAGWSEVETYHIDHVWQRKRAVSSGIFLQHSPKLMISNTFSALSSAAVHISRPSFVTATAVILPTHTDLCSPHSGQTVTWHYTQVCSEVLDELHTLFLLLPELDMAISAGSHQKVSPERQNRF